MNSALKDILRPKRSEYLAKKKKQLRKSDNTGLDINNKTQNTNISTHEHKFHM